MMVRPLSLDLRTRIAAAFKDSMTVRAAAERFGVSAATAVRVGQLDRSGQGLMPAKIGGYVKPTLRGAAADAVRQRLQVKSDWTVRTLSAELQSAGINVSHGTVWRFLRSEGKTFKKNTGGRRAGSPKGGPVPDAVEDRSASA
jgi:putative transposase